MSGVQLGGRESDLTIPECGLAIMLHAPSREAEPEGVVACDWIDISHNHLYQTCARLSMIDFSDLLARRYMYILQRISNDSRLNFKFNTAQAAMYAE